MIALYKSNNFTTMNDQNSNLIDFFSSLNEALIENIVSINSILDYSNQFKHQKSYSHRAIIDKSIIIEYLDSISQGPLN